MVIFCSSFDSDCVELQNLSAVRRQQGNVPLRIYGFEEQSTSECFRATQVPVDQPLSFTMTLVNGHTETVGGNSKVWLNDDRDVIENDTFILIAEPGRRVSATGTSAL